MTAEQLRMPDLSDEPYEPRGIFNSEMAFLIGILVKENIEVVIESGRARGQSTYLLDKYLPRNVIIHSVERFRDDDALFCEERLKDARPTLNLIYGDGRKLVPRLVEWNKGKRIAVLLDGPKGHPALDVLEQVKTDIVVAFIHDMRKLDHGKPASFRTAAEAAFPKAFFTDDEAWVESTRHIDAKVVEAGEAVTHWRPGFINGEATGSYGPTLGVFWPS